MAEKGNIIIIGFLVAVSLYFTFKLNKIMATQAELAQQLRDITAQNEKARVEILAKIAALEAAIATAGSTTPEVDAALADLKASVQIDDDLNPDA